MYREKPVKSDISYLITALLLIIISVMTMKYNRITGIIFIFTDIVLLTVALTDKIGTYKKFKNNFSLISKYIGYDNKEEIDNLPVPVLFCSENGNAVFCNKLFSEDVTGDRFYNKKSIIRLIDSYNNNKSDKYDIELYDNLYSVYISYLPSGENEGLYAMYFINDTYYKQIENEYKISRPVVIIVSIDSADEASDTLPHSLFTSFFADTEKMITEWFSERSCVFRKIGDDKFFAVTEYRYLNVMLEERFDITDKVRNYKINNKSAGLTLSIGVGVGFDLGGCEVFARQALEMAKGRGGDQTAVKNGENYQFFGGVSQAVEKSSQIRSRTVAKQIEELIKESSDIMIMGHKNSDLDSLGSAIGLAGALISMNKHANIVVDYETSLAKSIIDYYNSKIDSELFISPYEAEQLIKEKTLLIVVDTMRNVLLESSRVFVKAEKIIVIDHHRMSVDHITNADIFYHEPTVSSACEMVTQLIQYMPCKPLISEIYAECLLAGIYLDTKNFTLKTGVRTFESAAYLRDCGADTVAVRKLFSASAGEYELVNAIVSSAEIFDNIALAYIKSDDEKIRISSAKAADRLLDIKDIDASFVIFDENKGVINISARSYGKINVQIIMEQIGGGGHQTMAAAQIKDKSYEEIKQLITDTVKKY